MLSCHRKHGLEFFWVAITIIICRLILSGRDQGPGAEVWLIMLLNHLSLKSQAAILAIIYLCFVTEFTSKIKHCNMLKMAAYLLLPLHQLDKWMHLTLHFASLLFALHCTVGQSPKGMMVFIYIGHYQGCRVLKCVQGCCRVCPGVLQNVCRDTECVQGAVLTSSLAQQD